MTTLDASSLSCDTLQGMVNIFCKGYAYCTRGCGKWGSATCFPCIFRDARKLHDKASKEIRDGKDKGQEIQG